MPFRLYVLPFAIGLLFSMQSFGQNFVLSGTLTGLDAHTKVILSSMNGTVFHDTAEVSQDHFKMQCQLPGAGIYILRVGLVGQHPEHRLLYLDSGSVSLTGMRGDVKDATITSQDAYMLDYLKFSKLLHSENYASNQKMLGDSIILLSGRTGSYEGAFAQPGLIERFLDASKKNDDFKVGTAKKWLSENPNSDINAYVIYTFLQGTMTKDELKKALETLNRSAKNSLPAKKMENVSSGRRRF